MKCKNCGAELSYNDENYICPHCGSSFLREELLPSTPQSKDFKIVGGVLLKYLGNRSRVTIPNGVVSIGKDAFKNNLAVRKVAFSKSVAQIEANAFEGCANLTEIIDYSSVAKFGDECFRYAGLKRVAIGRNVVSLGRNCFSRMPNLEVVSYDPGKILKLNGTFAYCPKLTEVEEDAFYFFPSCRPLLDVRHNPKNKRPTWGDAFLGTPYIATVRNEYLKLVKRGTCPECGGRIIKLIFHAKCTKCGIDYKN